MGKSIQNKSTKSIKKLQWAGIDKDVYEQIVQEKLQNNKNMNERMVALKLEELAKTFHKATEAAVPHKLITLKGPSWRASPTVKNLLGICKQKYKL